MMKKIYVSNGEYEGEFMGIQIRIAGYDTYDLDLLYNTSFSGRRFPVEPSPHILRFPKKTLT